jgi:formylglycine-generating enzyme
MRSQRVGLLAVVVLLSAAASSSADVFHMPTGVTSLEFVTIGNPGNLPDTRVMNDGTTAYGAVGYTYWMGRFEVTSAQYVAFLNAVARIDPYGLYSPRMADPVSDVGCNIQRSGLAGSYSYSVASDYANRAVNYVSFGSAARFCNWLTNGQPTGTLTGDPAQDRGLTEDGSYPLSGATDNASVLAVTRRTDARYVIPSEDEWYKAAYHKNDGVSADYWVYPTLSDSAPTSEAPPGQSLPPGSANYRTALGSPYYLSEVGAYVCSLSAYGTLDQGGGMWEWNEATLTPTYRGTRGGSWLSNSEIYLRSDRRYGFSPTREYNFIGFRVAASPGAVPSRHAQGDTNGDGAVDVVDLLILAEAWGSLTGQTGYDWLADFNDDGSVDVIDLLTLAEFFGT